MQGDADFTPIITDENNTFIGVVIQYRVSGASEWLSLYQP